MRLSRRELLLGAAGLVLVKALPARAKGADVITHEINFAQMWERMVADADKPDIILMSPQVWSQYLAWTEEGLWPQHLAKQPKNPYTLRSKSLPPTGTCGGRKSTGWTTASRSSRDNCKNSAGRWSTAGRVGQRRG